MPQTGTASAEAREALESAEKEMGTEASETVAETAKQPEQQQAESKPEPKAEESSDADAQKAEKKAEPRPERKSQYIPVQKANEWRHEAQESKAKVADLERQLAEAMTAPKGEQADDLDALSKRIAGEDASPEVVKRILAAAKTLSSNEPNEDMKSLLALKGSLEKQNEEASFQRDLDKVLSKHPELKGHESELRETAYSEGNERIPLDLLAYRLKDDLNLTASPPSAEGKSRQAATEAAPDFDGMTEEQMSALTGADLDGFIEHQRKGARKRGLRI